jgi:hypothetical protein
MYLNTNSYNKKAVQTLTLDQVLTKAPSVGAMTAYKELSDNYRVYPTAQFINDIAGLGWYPTQAVEVKCRDLDQKGYQKHMVRFQHPECRLSDNEFLEMVAVNSTNGKSAFQLMLGVFRLVCSNGMVVCDSMASKCAVRHIGHTYEELRELSDGILNNVPLLTTDIKEMSGIELKQAEREVFARAAAKMLVDDTKEDYVDMDSNDQGVIKKEVELSSLLQPRRYEDRETKNTLWGTFNVIQENVIKGNAKVTTIERGRYGIERRQRKLREVKNIDRSVKINKYLWEMAEEMKRLKTVTV